MGQCVKYKYCRLWYFILVDNSVLFTLYYRSLNNIFIQSFLVLFEEQKILFETGRLINQELIELLFKTSIF